MKIKRSIFTLFALLGLLILTACGSDSGDADDQTTIKYWSLWNTGEPQQELLQEIIDDYEEANPDITVDVEWMGREVLADVRNAIQGGDPPDLADQSGAEVSGTLLKTEMAEPLNDLLTMEVPNEGVEFQDIYSEDVLSFHEIDGDTFYIPYEVITSGFHYNEELFSEYGIEPPETWDEFVDVGEKLQDEGVPPLAQDGNIDFYNAYYYYWLAERVMGSDSLLEAAGDESGETWSNEPGYLEAAEKVQEIVDKGFFADGYEGSQYPASQTSWAKGDSAMILNGSWISSETREYTTDDFVYRAFPFPEIEGYDNPNQAELYMEGWVAPKGANVEAVQDFLAFAMQEEYQVGITETGNLSPRHDVEAPDELSDFQEMVDNATAYHPEYDGLQAEYPKWWKTVFTPLNDKLIFGDINAEEFIEEIEKQTKEFWEN